MIPFTIGSFASIDFADANIVLDDQPCAVYTSHYVNGEFSHTTVERNWNLSCSGIDSQESHSYVSVMIIGNN